MNDETKNKIGEKISEVATIENIQKYILGTKKNGQPRAAYDILKDVCHFSKKKKKKKHKKNRQPTTYDIYLSSKKKKKKHKKKKKDKYWHI